jgi:hypothetical protein
MRRFSIACAALGLAAIALGSTSPAQASYKLIRWDFTGICQIWNNELPFQPSPSRYKTINPALPTFMDALAAKNKVFQAAKCTL